MKTLLYLLLILLSSSTLFAQNTAEVSTSWFELSPSRVLEYTFIAIAIILLIIIIMLNRFYAKMMQMRMSKSSESIDVKSITPMLLLIPSMGNSPFLQITASLDNTTFMFMVGIIAVELLVIMYLVSNINKLMQSKAELEEEARKADSTHSILGLWMSSLWYRMNKSVAVEKEGDILRHHEFDGIRELDNDLPPWWVWGFYLTIIFAVVYLWRYHVTQTAPLQEQELQISLVRAEEQIRAYRATAANLIDESNVEYNTDPAWLERGAQVYAQNCVACHGANGEGGVGPNMTDDYFIHGGDIQTIFRIVKNGVLEKGMTPWKDLLSPSQMAQVASYIKSMQGINIPNGKAPQGELYTEPIKSEGNSENALEMNEPTDSL
jgi:cytochrome c oxidase cbb3-type subunit III